MGFNAVKVAPQPHVRLAAQIAHVDDVIDHPVQIGPAVIAQKQGIEVDAHIPARLKQAAQLMVAQVARMIAQGAGTAVRGQGRGLAVQQVVEAALVQVGHIHRHVAAAHAANDVPAQRGQALAAAAERGMRHAVFIVPYQCGHAHAQVRETVHLGRIAAEGLAALDGQHRVGNALARLRKLGDLTKAALLQPFKGLQLPFHDGGAHAHAVCAHKQRQALHPHAAPGGQQLRCHIQRPSGGTVRRREGIERIGMGIANQHRGRSFPDGTGVPRLTPSRRSDCWA